MERFIGGAVHAGGAGGRSAATGKRPGRGGQGVATRSEPPRGELQPGTGDRKAWSSGPGAGGLAALPECGLFEPVGGRGQAASSAARAAGRVPRRVTTPLRTSDRGSRLRPDTRIPLSAGCARVG